MLKVIIAASLVGLAAAECPNACSGHGTCSKFDMCTCYSNWQGNDCSQRTCPFDLAHVDTPKGDLNGDQKINGVGNVNEDDLVLVGSTVYPQGTFEGFPATAVAQSAHFYMECSNKGICDRTTGECACFDGYEGTACQRASCPNDCSGHGTCETIEELSGDVVYKLWDRQATMGCKCDAGYGSADCSERACKYGVDPLYTDDTVGRYTEVKIVTDSDAGSFAIVFYDVHGEDYETAPIAHDAECSDVQRALVALPNDVIKCDLAATVDLDTDAAEILNSCVACEREGSAAPYTYTLGFLNNPGYLRPLEIITNRPGVFSNVAAFSVAVNTHSIGEFVDHFATDCKVAVTHGTDKISTASAALTKTLKKCLGDSDGDEGNNVDVQNWDLGDEDYPHAIKTVDSAGIVEFGLILFDADDDFTTLSKFSGTGSVSVFATDGVATIVKTKASSPVAAVGTAVGTFTLETTIDTRCGGKELGGGDDELNRCLSQGDSIFVFEEGVASRVQLYTIVRIATVVTTDGANTETFEIEVDYPLAVTGSALTVVHFEPSDKGSYEYVSQCSNRGTCDTSSGLCQCFKGYTGDDCSIQSALAV